jgi:hypothetical protein
MCNATPAERIFVEFSISGFTKISLRSPVFVEIQPN